jgi:hypothetical protein
VLIIAFIWNRNYYSLVKEITRIPRIIQSLLWKYYLLSVTPNFSGFA